MRRAGSHLVGTAHTTSRIEALTDGVIAIVMTLMVFEIRLPPSEGQALGASLAGLWPEFFAYGISFLQLGIYWSGHRTQFSFLVREDHVLRWICMLFLALVSLIPFSANLIGAHMNDPLALGLYAANLIAVSLVLHGQWLYATRGHRLVASDIPPEVVSTGHRRTITAPLLYLAGAALVVVSPVLTLVVFALVPIFYLFPVLIDRLWAVRA